MSVQLKQRIVGIIVITFLAIIVLPLLFSHHQQSPILKPKKIPPGIFISQNQQVAPQQKPISPAPHIIAEQKPAQIPLVVPKPAIKTVDAQTELLNTPEEGQKIIPKKIATNTHHRDEKNLSKIETHILKSAEPASPNTAVTKKKSKHLEKNKKPISIKEKDLPIPTHHTSWTIQLGSFSNKANADKLVKQLKSNGFKAYIKNIKNSAGIETKRVYVGPEVQHSKADITMQKLQKRFRLHGVVVKYSV